MSGESAERRGSATAHDGRIADRFPSTNIPASSLVSTSTSTFAPANDGGHPATTPPQANRVGKYELRRVADQLSDRDWAILRSVAEHRFLTVSQICVLHFHDLGSSSGLRRTQRVLARLRRTGLLETLTRRVGGVHAGSRGLTHYIAAAGEHLLRIESGNPVRQRWHEPSARFAEHHLAIADLRIELEIAQRRQTLELVRHEVEPAAWRRYTGLGGALITLKPDAYFETSSTPGTDFVDAWFAEIDLGHEGIRTLIKKCHEYEHYRRQGIEQEEGGFPWVIWILTHKDETKAERRRAALREAINNDRQLDPNLFHVAAPEQVLPIIQKGATI
ncbi:replication-relaxation family protein [Nocardia blacklockiae]|uniref:replication-relaxation family protein n=1 Tax=Nocardia blacklockiae TaxID=480036 RepID=UPI00189504B9|nr:replication-relaxation family protein [Nocardia blacklockiae]MBF6171287.1 replication-relaxation family protein [Nocardia blacklockiae]